jgi:hypothetical protein
VSTEPRIVNGLKVVEVEPDAPLPPDVPSWAERCDLVKTPNLSPAVRPWVIGAGALGTAASFAMLALTNGWEGTLGALLGLSIAALLQGLGTQTVITPSARGRYLVFDDRAPLPVSANAGESSGLAAAEAPAALVPREATGWRFLVGLIGVAMLFAAGALALGGGWDDLLVAAGAACLGGAMAYMAVTGHVPISPQQYTLSPRFAALADPARPLTAGDPVSGAHEESTEVGRGPRNGADLA